MKKAELEAAARAYEKCMGDARSAVRAGRIVEGVHQAVLAWEHVDAMMRYKQRFSNTEFSTIACVELVLEYAPLVLHYGSLDRLESLLKDKRRIEKNTSKSLSTALSQARLRLGAVHRLMDHLEQNSVIRQDALREVFGGDQSEWRELAERWEHIGLVEREGEGQSCRLRLTTNMGEPWRAKCQSCGKALAGAKRLFLEAGSCPACRSDTGFVLIARLPSEDSESC